jgi:hypothetical protein
VLGLFAGSPAGLLLYILNERFASDPILPLELFKNRTFSTANLAGFLVSMSFMSTVAFLPLFMQLGQGVAATTSGLSTLPLMGGLMVSSIVAGRMVSKTGIYKPYMIGGVVITFIGICAQPHARRDLADGPGLDASAGDRPRPGQSLFALAVQNALPMDRLVWSPRRSVLPPDRLDHGRAIFGPS